MKAPEKTRAIAIIRTSTTAQTGSGQRRICAEAAKQLKIARVTNLEFAAGANTRATKAAIAGAMKRLNGGDIIIVAELSRLGRTVNGILETMQAAQARNIRIFDARTGAFVGDSLSDTIQTTIIALVAEIEHRLIKERTKDAANSIQENIARNGFHITKKGRKITSLGRPKGSTTPPPQMAHSKPICTLHAQGFSYRKIASMYNCDWRTIRKVINLSNQPNEGA